jgi:hypothetical protein
VSECFESRGRTEMAADVGGGNSRLDGNFRTRGKFKFQFKIARGSHLTWVGGVDEWLQSEGSEVGSDRNDGLGAWGRLLCIVESLDEPEKIRYFNG